MLKNKESLGIKTGNMDLKLPYTQVSDEILDKSIKVVDIYRDFLGNKNIYHSDFKDFLDKYIVENNINENHIIGTEYKNNSFYIYTIDGSDIIIPFNKLNDYLVNIILKGTKKEKIEKRALEIELAIESIFYNNKGVLWNDEINDEDKVSNKNHFGKLGEGLEGKTLEQLKELLDKENEKLFEVYKITGETSKKERLLKRELKFYVGLGDTYEGGAKYFSMSTNEINKKVSKLLTGMSFENIINYIKENNNIIESNYKKSDMVDHVNQKLMNSLYIKTLDMLKKKNASNKYFIEFAKALTGRGKKISKKGENLEYKDIEIDTEYKGVDFANKALIYVMYRKDGVLDNIQQNISDGKINKINIKIEDEERNGESPSEIINKTIITLGYLNSKESNSGEKLLEKIGFGHLKGITKDYKDLSFEEKTSIGAMLRLTRSLSKEPLNKIQENPNIVEEILLSSAKDSYNDLNNSFSDNFDTTLFDWNGFNSTDLKLREELTEIFDLYQNINGSGIMTFSDDNLDMITPTLAGSMTLGIGVLSAAVAIGLLPATAGVLAIAAAGAAAGAMTGLTSFSLGRQGFDTIDEAMLSGTIQILGDAAAGALFLNVSIWAFKQCGINILEKAFFTKYTLVDIGIFGVAETLANSIIVSNILGAEVKKKYKENHFDTDKYIYKNGELIQRENDKLDK